MGNVINMFVVCIILMVVLGCSESVADRSEIRRKVMYELTQQARHRQLELETQELEKERNGY